MKHSKMNRFLSSRGKGRGGVTLICEKLIKILSEAPDSLEVRDALDYLICVRSSCLFSGYKHRRFQREIKVCDLSKY